MSDTYKSVQLENPEDSTEKWMPKTLASNVSLSSGNDLESELGDKYEKPSGGIPATDLAAGVIPDVSGKADKLPMSGSGAATENNFMAIDANGNIKDSGHKHSDYVSSQDLSGKVDKPSTATENNFAKFDSNKNVVDSGNKASDFLQSTNMIVASANSGSASTQSVTSDTTNPYVNLLIKRISWASSPAANVRFIGGNGISVIGNTGTVTISLPAPSAANTYLKYNGTSYEWAAAGGGSGGTAEAWTLTTSTGATVTKNVLIQS